MKIISVVSAGLWGILVFVFFATIGAIRHIWNKLIGKSDPNYIN